MKIIVCGKGGSGKSTITSALAKEFEKKGYNVLIIDADESNLGLHRLVGIESPVVLMDNLGGKKGFKEKSKPVFPGGSNELFKPQMTLDEIDDACITVSGGIKMMSIGKIHTAGEGCACPMGVLSKLILSRLIINDKDVVLIDTTAGVEHFGRGLDSFCDLVIGVVDPTKESLLLSEKISAIAEKEGLDTAFVLNKTDQKVEAIMRQNMNMDKVIAEIPNSGELFMAGLEGKMIEDGQVRGIESAVRFIIEKTDKTK